MSVPNTAFRIHVSGLARTLVKYYDGGIVEEDNLGYFFYDKGCEVDAVRLMVDQSSGKCRGFGFVDFADEASFEKALTFDGERETKEVRLDPLHSDGLVIKVAKPAESHVRDKRRELARAQDRTEEMEREFRHREARVRELEREVKAARERQKRMEVEHCLESQLKEQKARQEEIQKEGEKLAAAERYYAAVLRNEQCRTQAMETLVTHVDPEQHKDVVTQEEKASKGADDGGDGDETPLAHADNTVGEPEWRVHNTFIEYYLPVPEKSPLVRTRTAPPTYTAAEGTGVAGNGAAMEEESQSSLPPAPTPPAPWTLQRESSSILRSILEDKIEAEEAEASSGDKVRKALARGKSTGSSGPPERGGAGSEPAEASAPSKPCRWADVTEDDEESPVPPRRRTVRLRNLPLAESEHLKDLVHEELKRLWESARHRPAPNVESVEIRDVTTVDEATYAQKAMGTEALVTFAAPEDAAWLVDGRRPRNWSSTETLSVLGRVLNAEWPPAAVSDWRKLCYKADTDESSNISYGTVGTRQSMSSLVARVKTAGGSVENLAANRTVILTNISTTLPTHTVRREVLDLLKRLWHRDGLRFDPAVQLHRGADGGIDVRAGRKAGEENGGSVVVKLRNYADAKWLVEQARGLSIEGRTCKASWAKPRRVGGA